MGIREPEQGITQHSKPRCITHLRSVPHRRVLYHPADFPSHWLTHQPKPCDLPNFLATQALTCPSCWRHRTTNQALTTKQQPPYLPRSSEKLIPSLILPPTTESSRAPVIWPADWLQRCRRGTGTSDQEVSETHLGWRPLAVLEAAVSPLAIFLYADGCQAPPTVSSAHLYALGVLRQHLLHLVGLLGLLEDLSQAQCISGSSRKQFKSNKLFHSCAITERMELRSGKGKFPRRKKNYQHLSPPPWKSAACLLQHMSVGC